MSYRDFRVSHWRLVIWKRKAMWIMGDRGRVLKEVITIHAQLVLEKSYCSVVLNSLGKYTMESLLFCRIDEEML